MKNLFTKVSKIFGGGVKSDPPKQGTEHGNPKHKPKNLIHDHNGWIRTVTLLVVFALIWGQVPVAGSVTDNMPSVIQRILGIREDTVAAHLQSPYIHHSVPLP